MLRKNLALPFRCTYKILSNLFWIRNFTTKLILFADLCAKSLNMITETKSPEFRALKRRFTAKKYRSPSWVLRFALEGIFDAKNDTTMAELQRSKYNNIIYNN